MDDEVIFDANGKLVLTRKKRHLEDDFISIKETSANIGFDIENREFETFDILYRNFQLQSLPLTKDSFAIPGENIPTTIPVQFASVARRNQVNRRKNDIQPIDNYKGKYETAEQHKYARLAAASYNFNDKDKVAALFSTMDELKGFILDTELSNDKHSVFHNSLTGETVISYKGTNPTHIDDLYTDLQIAQLFTNEDNTHRFKESEKVYEETKLKYGSVNAIASHSLGGTIALHVSNKYNVDSYVFNPGISLEKVAHNDTTTSKQYIFRTEMDPVSIGSKLIDTRGNRTIITVKQKNILDSHSIDNFYSNAIRNNDGTFQVENKTTMETISDDVFDEMFNVAKTAIQHELDEISSENPLENSATEFRGFSEHEAHAFGLDKVADILKSDTRKKTDLLMNIESEKSENIRTDLDGDIISKDGIRYHEVMGENFSP